MDEISPEVCVPSTSSLEDASWGDAVTSSTETELPASVPTEKPVSAAAAVRELADGEDPKTELVELMKACEDALEGAALRPKLSSRETPIELALFSAAELATTPLPLVEATEQTQVNVPVVQGPPDEALGASELPSTCIVLATKRVELGETLPSNTESSSASAEPTESPLLAVAEYSSAPLAVSAAPIESPLAAPASPAPSSSASAEPAVSPLLAVADEPPASPSLSLVAGAPIAEAAAAGEVAPQEIPVPSVPAPAELAAEAVAAITAKHLSPAPEVFAPSPPSVMVLPSVMVSAELLNLTEAERGATKALPPLVFDERQQPKTEPELNLPDHVAPVSELAGAELAVLAPEEPTKPIPLTLIVDNAGPIITPLETRKPVVEVKPELPPPAVARDALFRVRVAARVALTAAAVGVAAFGFFSSPEPAVAPPARTARPSHGVQKPHAVPEPALESPELEAELSRQAEVKSEPHAAAAPSHPSEFSWTGIKGLSWKKHSSPHSVASVRIGRPANPAPLPGTEPTFVDPDLQGEMAKVK